MFPFQRWWRRAQVPVLGIDLGTDAIRVIGLAGRDRRWPLNVSHYACQPLPRGAMRDGAVAMPDEVAAALRDAIRLSGSRLRDVALALPAGAAIRKTLTLPSTLSEDDIELLIEAEASESLPFPRDEIGLDFAIAGPTEGQPDSLDVVLVAARRERIDERVALARAAGLRPLIVDIESHALVTAITLAEGAREATASGVIAALWLGPDRSHCLFMADGVLVYERELGIANAGGDAANVDRICQDVDRALQLFQTATVHAEPQKIYLLGHVPHGLPSALQQRANTPVAQPDPLAAWSAGREKSASDTPSSCMIACGLALRSFCR